MRDSLAKHVPEVAPAIAPVLVVGVDGSSTSWDAFDWAVKEARRTNGRVVAAHITSAADPAAAFGVVNDYVGLLRAEQAVDEELREHATRRAGQLGVPVDFVSRHGDATRILAELARSLHADLVVVGRSMRTVHRLAGSLSHRLTNRDDSPVVVVVP